MGLTMADSDRPRSNALLFRLDTGNKHVHIASDRKEMLVSQTAFHDIFDGDDDDDNDKMMMKIALCTMTRCSSGLDSKQRPRREIVILARSIRCCNSNSFIR